MGVLFVQRDLVAEMRELFRDETDAQTSYRVFVADDGSLRWEGETEGRMEIHDREPQAGVWRRLIASIVTWLPIESQL
jgi:putative cardiolipin synthase